MSKAKKKSKEQIVTEKQEQILDKNEYMNEIEKNKQTKKNNRKLC